MNSLVAWKKVVLFGLFGAAGCLAGWVVGEPFLAISSLVAKSAGTGQGPTLISSATPAEPPPPPREFQDRLKNAKPGGAGTGDIQISLIWFNSNDLDLHCVDPSGFEICWRPTQRFSHRTGGELDVDRNAGCRLPSAEPVENIYWPAGRAPQGRYRVYLNFYQKCPGAPNDSSYKINVLHGGTRKEFSGTIASGETPEGSPRLIYEFQAEPKLEVVAPAEFELGVGATLKVPVAVRREFVPGKLDVKVENLPDGVTAEPLTISPGESKGELVLKATDSADTGKKKIKITAAGEGGSGAADSDMTVGGRFSLWSVLAMGFWTALLAVGLCLALLVGENKYLGKSLFAPSRIPLAMVIVGAVAAGFASGTLGQALFYLLMAIGASKFGFLVGWVLLGGLLGWGVSFFIPNLDGKKAGLAGLGGGFLGALGFVIFSYAHDTLGRFAGAALLGFCIGLVVAVVEVAFRRAWLEVRFGEREAITVNLGPEPVKVGSDSRSCAVWARGAAEIALRYWIRDGKVYCEDVPSKREAIVTSGDTRQAGGVTVIVRTSGTPAPVGAPRVAPPVPQARPTPPLPTAVPTAVPVPVPLPQATRPPVPPPPPAAPKPPAKSPVADYDDGMPMPMGPPPPARTGATSILDIDDLYAQAGTARPKPIAPTPAASKPAPPAQKPAAPAPPSPAKSMAPPAPKPPAPAAPKPAPPAPKPAVPPSAKPPATGPVITAKPGADSCPTCGRKISGAPGARYCMVCDKTF